MAEVARDSSGTPHVALPSGERAAVEGGLIALYSGDGRLVVSYSDEAGLCIEAANGDLTLRAPHGRVVLEGDVIDMRARRWKGHIEHALLAVGRWELTTERSVETAKDMFRRCEGAYQVRAGRMRQLVTGAFDVVAGRTSLASEEETHIDGKKVLLG